MSSVLRIRTNVDSPLAKQNSAAAQRGHVLSSTDVLGGSHVVHAPPSPNTLALLTRARRAPEVSAQPSFLQRALAKAPVLAKAAGVATIAGVGAGLLYAGLTAHIWAPMAGAFLIGTPGGGAVLGVVGALALTYLAYRFLIKPKLEKAREAVKASRVAESAAMPQTASQQQTPTLAPPQVPGDTAAPTP